MDFKSKWENLREKLSPVKKTLYSVMVFGTIGFVGLSVMNYSDIQELTAAKVYEAKKEAVPVKLEENVRWGMDLNEFKLEQSVIDKNQFLADILLPHGLSAAQIQELAANAKDVFPVHKLRAGFDYNILKDKDGKASYFIYEPNVYEYVVYELKDSLNAFVHKKEVTTEVNEASGIIESSLWNAMVDNGMDYALAAKMEEALAWSVDFYHLHEGDQFKLIYEQQFVEGEKAGIGKIIGAYYKNFDNEYYAIRYKNEKYDGFYDEEGRPSEKAFLKSPVKYARISSRYNLRRFHPVLKRVRPHFGTDYAAPYGTPIHAVGNGVVIKASRTRGNGNYVKIKHDKTYTTQYLHMQKFAKGIRSGAHVKQGQVIGYVGSTGLATGPHVCFRFWKNDKQVDHLRLNFPPPDPLPKEQLADYMVVRNEIKSRLDAIGFKSVKSNSAKDSLTAEPVNVMLEDSSELDDVPLISKQALNL